jgi:hypothetical protein
MSVPNKITFSLDFRNGLHLTLVPEDYDLLVYLIKNGMSDKSKNAVKELMNKPAPWENIKT